MQRETSALPVHEAVFAAAFAAPRRVAVAGIVGLALLGWVYLIAMATAAGLGGTFAALGPGMSLLDGLGAWLDLDRIAYPIAASSGLLAALMAVCAVDPAAWGPGAAVLHLGMWSAMALAMMLPSAAPMLRTYAEIAEAAAARDERIVSPLVLAAGYLAVWLAFALAATLAHWLLGQAGLLSGSAAPVAVGAAAVIIACAGLYQFLPVKAACLVKCANPFPYLFANWTERPSGVLQLGLRQGLYCLGCCWAMMTVMFAVGAMNLVWIAILAGLMTAEKLIGATWFSHALGAAALVWAVALGLGGVGAIL